METASLIFMLLVEGSVTAMAIYFFCRMLRSKK